MKKVVDLLFPLRRGPYRRCISVANVEDLAERKPSGEIVRRFSLPARDQGRFVKGRRRGIYVGRRSKSTAKIFACLELQKDLVEATDQVY